MTGVIKTDANGVVQTDTNGVIQTVTSATAQFDVAIASTTSPVAPGDELGVTADVSNSGGAQGTQTITLNINNGVGQVDSASVTLSAGGSTTQALSWVVPSGQTEQDYTATVASADDTASQTVTISSGQTVFGFETADFSRWASANSLDSINTTYVYEGSFSGFQDTSQDPVGRLEPGGLAGGGQPTKISWAYRETGDGSVGGAVSIHDSTDAVICGAGSSNPDHEVNYASGWNRFGTGNGYERWIVYTLSFDWTNGTFVATAEDTQANETFTSASLALGGTDVEAIEIRPFSAPPDFDSGLNHENWWDSFTIVQ